LWTPKVNPSFPQKGRHEGYRSCFFRKASGDTLEIVGERIFDPKEVYGT